MHHKIVPLCLVLIGVFFFLQALGMVSAMTVAYVWPLLLILIGLQKMCKGKCGCCGKGEMKK